MTPRAISTDEPSDDGDSGREDSGDGSTDGTDDGSHDGGGSLPRTGSDLGVLFVGIGAAVLGAAALTAARRRRG